MKHLIVVTAALVLVAVTSVEAQNKCDDQKICQNQGTCSGADNSKICTCLNGYSGDNCETAPVECKDEKCNDKGTCYLDDDKKPLCKCSSGYGGAKCDVANCVNDKPCANRGTCDGTATKKCKCLNGYTGDNCETVPEACKDEKCNEKGICKLDTDGKKPHCECDSGYEGAKCDVAVAVSCTTFGLIASLFVTMLC